MSELPDHHRPRRARLLALAGALCALGLLLGAAAARGSALDSSDPREQPTIQVTVSPTSAAPAQNVTLTATITGKTTFPAGTVKFTTTDNPNGAIDNQSFIAVQAVAGSPLEAKATLDTSFGAGTYDIVAYWTPTDVFTFQSADTTGAPVELNVSDSTTPTKVTTHTALSMDPETIVQGQHEALTATVTADDGSTPTGEVFFYDGIGQLGDPVQLVGGVATNPDVGSFGAGPHDLYAIYQATGVYKGSQSGTTSVTVEDTSPKPTTTQVELTVSQPLIRQGDTVDLTAHVTQVGGGIVPPGGKVTFYSNADCNSGTLLTAGNPAPVDANGDAKLTGVGSWAVQDYTLCASYVGDSFGTSTPGTAKLTVLAPLKSSTLELSGPTSAEYGTPATFTAHLVDSVGPVAGKTVTIQLGSQSCSSATDAGGDLQCTFTANDTNVSSVKASFAGDLADDTSSASQDFAVTPAPTTLTVAMNGPTRLIGTLVDSGGAPLGGILLTLSLDGNTCTATTNSSGVGTCTIDRLDVTTATLAGSSAADARYQSGTFSELVTVPSTIETTLQYTGPVTGDYGDGVTLSAVLLDSSQNGVDGKSVTLKLGTQSCEATTSSDGTASCTLTVAQPSGTLAASAHFAGNDPYLASDSDDVPFAVTKEESSLTLSAPTTVVSGDTATFTATLREDGTGAIEGRTLTFTFDGATCTKATGADGTATCTLPSTGSGTTEARVSFAGDDEYAAPTDATADVLVQLHTTLTYTGATTGDFHDGVTASAHLADQTGAAVADGAAVTFTLGSQQCTGTTASGDASCTLTPDQRAAATTLHVSYAGDGSVLLPTSIDPAFTVAREETTLSLTAPPAAQQGSTITLTAKLLEDGTTPIDGRTVTFKNGASVICTGTTSGGVATCTVPATTLGPLTVIASFAADDDYLAAASSATTTYVFAPTPGGGMFVVGDLSATGNVTFWGSQWWKANTLSSRPAPSSFKGYALHASTTCGGTWSTDPGNSTPPPAGPLPSYIAVIVASSAGKSGAAISGHEVHVVVVKTSAGYDGNPGHAGTGAVVAPLC